MRFRLRRRNASSGYRRSGRHFDTLPSILSQLSGLSRCGERPDMRDLGVYRNDVTEITNMILGHFISDQASGVVFRDVYEATRGNISRALLSSVRQDVDFATQDATCEAAFECLEATVAASTQRLNICQR